MLIFGDSYSTFKGSIPEGYANYYSETEGADNSVTSANLTWWGQLINETDSNLIRNDSWSGSTICHQGYAGMDCSETFSFLDRIDRMNHDGFSKKETIDTVSIFGGINDSWANVPIGEIKYDNYSGQDLRTVLPGICAIFGKVKEYCPNAKVICIINTGLKEEITSGMCEACAHYGFDCVTLKDIDKSSEHPTFKGMCEIKNQILLSLNQ